MKISTKLAFLVALAIFIFSGCKKDSSTQLSKPLTGKTSVTNANTDSLVLTPAGWVPKSHVFLIAKGHQLSVSNGRVIEIEKANGKLIKDLAEYTPAVKPLTNLNLSNNTTATSSPHHASVPSGANWITYADWYNYSSTPISYFSTNWVVPNPPSQSNGQTIYLFNALENSTGDDILQPVLQWGSSYAGGGSYWTVANWFLWGNYVAVQMPIITVSAGTSLQGIMTLTGQKTDGSYNYTSAFSGYSNTLTVTEGANINKSNGTIPIVAQQVWATETLEAYNTNSSTAPPPTLAADYPNALMVAMTNIQIKLGTSNATLAWGVDNNVTTFGQHTIIVSNSSPGGEVDLYFKMATNPLMSQVFYKNNCTTGQGSGVAYVVPAGKYSGSTQADANAQAQTEINNNGQGYANTNGSCNLPYTFGVVTTNASPTWFMLIVNGQNISGPRGTAPQNQNNNVSSTMNTLSNSTVVMQITSGYMPVSATLNGPFPQNHGVISGNNITFSNVNLAIGSSCNLTIN